MSLIVRDTGGGGDFEPAPEGVQACVCVDVVDLGLVTQKFGKEENTRPMVRIVWASEEIMADGQPFLLFRRATASLHEKAALRALLESWRGKKFSPKELEGFDLESLVGAGCQINVVHNVSEKNGRTYANVAAIMPLGKGDKPPAAPANYVRVKDRQVLDQPSPQSEEEPPPIDDEDLPF